MVRFSTCGPQRLITTAAEGASSVFATDLDGDVDVLSALEVDGTIDWYWHDPKNEFSRFEN